MKKTVLLLIFLTLFALVSQKYILETKKEDKPAIDKKVITPTRSLVISPAQKSLGICVPYWTVNQEVEIQGYDNLYYFGIAPNADGSINSNDEGFKQINSLSSQLLQTYVIVRMTDPSQYESILAHTDVQSRLAQELHTFVAEKKIPGIILDLEVSYTLQKEKEKQITAFVDKICSSLHIDKLFCGMFVYGDSFYRKRPYNIKELGNVVDRIFIMTYDFHTAKSEPGPNFSLSNKKLYGYDVKQMIHDFTSVVSKEKIEMVFGMYGYDWTLNEQGTPLKSGIAISVKSLKSKVESMREVSGYRLQVTKNSDLEKKITYSDEQGRNHIIWYEDEESAKLKMEYAQTQGITHFSYWAYTYF